MDTRIAIVGDYDPANPSHIATTDSLRHLSLSDESVTWVPTRAAETLELDRFDGFWIAPGSPYTSMTGALRVIRYARETQTPLLGTCGGFQHVILEHARNVLNFADAQHAEYDPTASHLFISKLVCSLVGREMTIRLRLGSRIAQLYGAIEVTEQYYCNFGVNPDYQSLWRDGDLLAVGSDAEGEIRVVERIDHPFFLATLFLPQLRSTMDRPHPVVTGFVRSTMARVKVY